MSPSSKHVYKVTEVAAFLGLDRRSVTAGLERGEIPGVRVGRIWLVPRARFQDWFNGTPTSSIREEDRPDA